MENDVLEIMDGDKQSQHDFFHARLKCAYFITRCRKYLLISGINISCDFKYYEIML